MVLIKFDVRGDGPQPVEICVYDCIGRHVARPMAITRLEPGSYTAIWHDEASEHPLPQGGAFIVSYRSTGHVTFRTVQREG